MTDIIVANLADMHTGGTTALFLDGQWEGEHQKYWPSKKQEAIYKHFLECAKHIREKIGKGKSRKQLIIVNSGDAIDGNFHPTHQVITRILHEQTAAHIELMEIFMRACGFCLSAGDKLVYIKGTESHTGEEEASIAKHLGAQLKDHAEVIANKRHFWFVHKGGGAGAGANRGNSLRNRLRDIYFDCLENGDPIPDMVSYAHAHDPEYNTYVRHGKTIHGYICPSWQIKTRFGNGVAPVTKSNIGMAVTEITSEGNIIAPYFFLLRFDSASVV